MSMPKISIIMPSLNVRPYIEECLDSVLGQTMQEIEIFCVDAGSTDGTLEVIQKYAFMDSRIQVIISDKKSYGHQMNLAVDRAKGKYIGIVETDDYIVPDMFTTLYAAAKEYGVDVCRMDYARFWGDGKSREILPKHIAGNGQYGRIIVPAEEQEVFLNDPFNWSGIYRREYLLEKDIWHNETPGAAYQDTGFWFQSFAFADSILYLPQVGYHYRLDNPGSSIHNPQKAFAFCDELQFVRRKLEMEQIFERFKKIFYTLVFNRYLWSYQRAGDDLRLSFAKRFREDMLPAEGMDLLISDHQKELLTELRASPDEFHSSREQERINWQSRMASNCDLVVVGCGNDGIRMMEALAENDALVKVVCLADNDQGLQGQIRMGKRILSPAETYMLYPEANYLIASLKYGDELKSQLLSLGAKPEQIWTGHIL